MYVILNMGVHDMTKIAIIGGTGLDELVGRESGQVVTVTTRFGSADMIMTNLDDIDIVFIPRHGFDHSVPPSLVNYRAQIAALKKLNVCRVIGVAAVGTLRQDIQPASFAILGDFLDFTKRRIDTFFDEPKGGVVHTDFTIPYCPEISEALIRGCREEHVDFFENAVYMAVEGPRYETPAEIRLYSSWGAHVIGMTNVPEVVLAREAGLCYGAIAVVANLASGLSPIPLSHEEVKAIVKKTGANLQSVLKKAICAIPPERRCLCATNTALNL